MAIDGDIGKTFGQLLPGIVNIQNFPFESAPLGSILGAAPNGANLITYTAAADIACPVGGATMKVTLPGHGFRYAGNSTFSFGGSSPSPTGDPAISGNDLTWTVPGSDCSQGTQNVALSFQVQPGTALGSFSISLVVTRGASTTTAVGLAPVTTTDGLEPNNTPATATPASPNTLYLTNISTPTDIEYFNLPVTNADVGRMVRISLSHLPGVDYDLVLYGANASSSLRGAPIGHGPIGHGPIGHGPLGDDGQCLPPGTLLQPQTLQDVPQTPSDAFGVRGYSTNRGTQNEFACAVVQPEDVSTGLLIQVSTYNGASAPDPALLSVEESAPVTPLGCITLPGGSGDPGPALPAPGSLSTDTQTLFLTNLPAIGKFYSTADEANVRAALTDSTFLNMPNVKGAVLSVDQDPAVAAAYAAWYADYCSPSAANGVVRAINQLVDSYRNASPKLPNLRNIVLVGSDAVLPFARIQELVSLGSESSQAANVQYQGSDNPTSRSLSLGYMLSDDPYYSFQAVPWLSTNLYPPSVAGGRLVETPTDIVNAINQYKTFNGVLDPQTEFTTGYDFFTDSAQSEEVTLHVHFAYASSHGHTYISQISEGWAKTDLANAINAQPGNLAANAHADQYRLLPAAAFHSGSVSPSDLYSTSDLIASSLANGTLAYSIGCHAGLSVPDVWLSSPDPSSLDWAQAFARMNGVFDGNTGFGYGDTNTIAYSAKLVAQLTRDIGPAMSIGQAVAYAKQQYYSSLGAWGVFHAKSVEEFTPCAKGRMRGAE